MNAKEAINAAKSAFRDLFADEGIYDLGLEEVVYDDHTDVWHLTMGFYRVLSTNPLGVQIFSDRIYKVVSLSGRDGALLSVKNRDVVQA